MPQLDRDGVAVYYELHGVPSPTAPPLLLTHGYSSSSAMWAPNIDALAADRLVIAWDIRGHGRSASPPDPERYSEAASVEDMAAILDAADVARAVVVGLSLGGYLSLAFHLEHPERVAGLGLFDTGPGYRSDDGRARWNSYVEATARRLEERGLDALSTSAEARLGDHDPVGLALAARGIMSQHDDRVIRSLPSIAVPVLVLVGANDEGFLAAAKYMTTHIPSARHVVLDGAGHAANIDRPAEFNEAVLAFLASVSS